MQSTVALRRKPASGFTLIEMMITVAIVAILAAVAYPSYTEHIRKSRRVDAKAALLDVAAKEERFSSLQNRYSETPSDIGYVGAAFPIDIVSSGTAYYQLNVRLVGTGYVAAAAPIGAQLDDGCGTFTIDNTGTQTVSGPKTTAECW